MADFSKNKRDRNRWFIAGILFFISIWMLMVPVMPHHHHSNGMMCMKNDVTADCCTPTNEDGYDRTQQTDHQQRLQTTSGNHHHCCCNTDCVTLHFLQHRRTKTDMTGHSKQTTSNGCRRHPETIITAAVIQTVSPCTFCRIRPTLPTFRYKLTTAG